MTFPKIIAEVKTDSPFGFKSEKTWDELFQLADSVGDMISIHTDPRWNGSFELLKRARSLTDKPILAKGIHATDDEVEKAVQCGADYVLVVGRIPLVHLDKVIIEPFFVAELRHISVTVKCLWNSRDLDTGGMKAETFTEARKAFKGWLCQASNIKTIEDVDVSADAILVGTALPEFIESLKHLKR